MNLFNFRILLLLLTLAFVFNGCDKDEYSGILDKENVSILGTWQMYGTTKYGLTFTNYGIVKIKRQPYIVPGTSYTYAGTTLTISGVNGTAIFSKDGNTLEVSGFSDPSSHGKEGAKGPFINGIYIRQ